MLRWLRGPAPPWASSASGVSPTSVPFAGRRRGVGGAPERRLRRFALLSGANCFRVAGGVGVGEGFLEAFADGC